VALLNEIAKRISHVGNWIGMSVLVLMMLLVISNIIIRFFGGVISSTYELVELMAAVAISFCIVYATAEKAHIVVDILLSRLSKQSQSFLGSITSFLGLGTWGLIAVASAIFARKQWLLGEVTDILDIPITPFRYVWVFALIILCLLVFIQLYNVLRSVVRK
jgi:TRAP-type C4-dicarboxylate transport system permease small subunit